MARQPLDPPSALGRRISSVIRREMGDRRLSGRAVARAIGKSEAYVRERVKDTYEFTLGDVDAFCTAFEIAPDDFFALLEQITVEDMTPAAPNVDDLRKDDHALAAKKRSRDRGGETGEG